MFVDRVLLEVEAGKGGDGAVSFLHETCMPRGGPDGGDGGDGGSVILRASPARMTLQDVGSRRLYKAPHGANGKGKKMAGRGGKDLVIVIPVGTLVHDESGAVVFDLIEPGDYVLCKGGRGGKGNARFATAINQAPRIATRGGEGQKGKFRLELKLIAEVGIVGLPNAGKSTLLASVSRATPKIAAYPFTTLHPHLGVAASLGLGRELILADIPGLIEGASQGKGLGDDFLRHVERTRLLLHLVDGTTGDEGVGGPTPESAYRTVRHELDAYRGADLSTKPEVVALNKVDALDPEVARARAAALEAAIGKPVLLLSGVSGEGTRALLEHLEVELKRLAAQEAEAEAQASLDGL
jgi:GTP-binding protein